MTEQEDFVHRTESRIREWRDKIEDLNRKRENAGPEAREELDRRIGEYHHRILDTEKKLREYYDHVKGVTQDREAIDHAGNVLKSISSEP